MLTLVTLKSLACSTPVPRTGMLSGVDTMAQPFHAGQIIPESGLYRVWHEPAHIGASNEVTFIRGRRFPACPGCNTVSFEMIQSDEMYRQHWSSYRGRPAQSAVRSGRINVATPTLRGFFGRAGGTLLSGPSRFLGLLRRPRRVKSAPNGSQ